MQEEHKSILSLINSGIASALKNEFKVDQGQIAAILEKATVTIPDDISNGHWTSNVAMVSAGIVKSSPRDLANEVIKVFAENKVCLLYTSPSPRDLATSRMPSSA